MERKALLLGLVIAIPAFALFGTAFASPQVEVTTSKPAYKYGDCLSFLISVSNVTGDQAVLEIVDQSNHSSSPVNIMITKPVSNITAPVPFYKTTFSPGPYLIMVQYSGSNATAGFSLVDTENISIPPQFKVVAISWVQNQTSSRLFGEHIAELVNSGVIQVENYREQNMTVIPYWFKNDAKWWSEGGISDNDFGHVVEYLLELKIMRV